MRRNGLLLLLVAIVACSGCGYKWGAPYPANIETVCVEMFGSREFRRDIELQLTEAIQKRIGMDTPYRLETKARADSVLRGEVLEVRQAAWAPDWLSRLPREKLLTLVVRLQWQDLRSGRIMLDRDVELQAVDFLPPVGETEEYAIQKAVEKMAEKITRSMYDEW